MSAATIGWRIARASRQGDKNRQRETACQDFSGWAAIPSISPDTLVAAVADGMGSAPLSGQGAQMAVHAAVSMAVALLHQTPNPPTPERLETILNAAMLSARQSVQQAAAVSHIPSTSMATTLLLAIHTADTMAIAQIGDGACVASTDQDHFLTLSRPMRGEYANETFSITSPRALQQCSIDIAKPRNPVQSIILMTDGMVGLTLAQADHEPHQPFFRDMTRWLADVPARPHPNTELAAILESDPIRRKTDDDTTLLLAVRQ